ncbi:hypothetical protein VCHENC02_4090A, partial [Vibrio harveyi]
MCQQKSYRIV